MGLLCLGGAAAAAAAAAAALPPPLALKSCDSDGLSHMDLGLPACLALASRSCSWRRWRSRSTCCCISCRLRGTLLGFALARRSCLLFALGCRGRGRSRRL